MFSYQLSSCLSLQVSNADGAFLEPLAEMLLDECQLQIATANESSKYGAVVYLNDTLEQLVIESGFTLQGKPVVTVDAILPEASALEDWFEHVTK